MTRDEKRFKAGNQACFSRVVAWVTGVGEVWWFPRQGRQPASHHYITKMPTLPLANHVCRLCIPAGFCHGALPLSARLKQHLHRTDDGMTLNVHRQYSRLQITRPAGVQKIRFGLSPCFANHLSYLPVPDHSHKIHCCLHEYYHPSSHAP